MKLETIVAIVAIVPPLVGLLVIIKNNTKQLNVQSFIKFTERFDSIEAKMPEIWKKRRLCQLPTYESTKELNDGLRAYAHLCSQEFHLYIHGHITMGIWSIWEQEIEGNFRSGLLVREWSSIESEFRGYPVFHKYVNTIQNTHEKHVADRYCVGFHGKSIRLIRRLGINKSRI